MDPDPKSSRGLLPVFQLPNSIRYCVQCNAPLLKRKGSKRALRRKFCDEGCNRLYGHVLRGVLGLHGKNYCQLAHDQGWKCAICGRRHDPGGRLVLVADHDHKTMLFRGLLCRYCNPGLGYFKDSTTNLRRAIIYLSGLKIPGDPRRAERLS
jgi:hypothetical protein